MSELKTTKKLSKQFIKEQTANIEGMAEDFAVGERGKLQRFQDAPNYGRTVENNCRRAVVLFEGVNQLLKDAKLTRISADANGNEVDLSPKIAEYTSKGQHARELTAGLTLSNFEESSLTFGRLAPKIFDQMDMLLTAVQEQLTKSVNSDEGKTEIKNAIKTLKGFSDSERSDQVRKVV